MARAQKIAWVDCGSGVAGSMLLGALIDLGFPVKRLRELAQSFKLGKVRIEATRKTRKSISGILVRIEPEGHQQERNFNEIKKIISRARLPEDLKSQSIDAFLTLAQAEAKVHGASLNEIHFHELGAVDTIIDIVGVTLGFQELGIDKIYASRVRLGSGEVRCAHGLLPVPAPATLELVQGLPVSGGSDGDGELTTPTGAVLIRSLAREFGPLPEMKIRKIGYGLGERELETRPNALRIAVGEPVTGAEQMLQIESVIDDMNPEFFEPLLARLAEAGALETALVPAQLKKNRPGVILRVLCRKTDSEQVIDQVFRNSTTTGVRFFEVGRSVLSREIITIKTRWGKIPAKKIELPNGEIRIHPEYEHLRKIAARERMSLIDLEREVIGQWRAQPKKA